MKKTYIFILTRLSKYFNNFTYYINIYFANFLDTKGGLILNNKNTVKFCIAFAFLSHYDGKLKPFYDVGWFIYRNLLVLRIYFV